MEIRYLKHQEINKKRWDECVKNATNPLIYGFSWYLDLVCDDWDAMVVGNYAAVLPLPWKRRYGIRYLYQPPYAQQLGLFSCIPMSASLVDEVLEAIPKRFSFAEIFLNTPAFPQDNEVRAFNNYMLDLSPRYELLREGYSNNLKRNLKRGEELKLQVSAHADLVQITNMFKANRGKDLENRHDPNYFRLRRLFNEAIHRGMGIPYGTYNQTNELIAGGLFLFDHHRIIFLFSGLSEQGRETGAMPVLIDHVIKEFAGNHLVLDFEGSMQPGLARFYGSFGATPEHYWFYRFNRLPFPLKQLVDKVKK